MKPLLVVLCVAPFALFGVMALWHEFQPQVIESANGVRFRRENKKSREIIEREFPMVVELFAILLSSNQSPATALMHISERASGVFSGLLREVVYDIKHGASFAQAVEVLSERTGSAMVRRFTDSMVIAIERGSPLLEVVNRQVAEVRQEQKVALMEAAGKAEIGLMIPVVFLILPISVLFALWPSYYSLGRAVGF